MGTVIRLGRGRDDKAPRKRSGQIVVCEYCGERHPVVRLQGGQQRCLTAFFDEGRWFCRNRGCRAAWLGKAES